MAIRDRYGLELTTASAVAAERFQDGMDRLLSYGAGAEDSFAAALEADAGLAGGHTGIAGLAWLPGDPARARADHVSMDARLIIVDGYNLILRSPRLKPGPSRTLRESRGMLLNLLSWMMGGNDARVVVVFDGAAMTGARPGLALRKERP